MEPYRITKNADGLLIYTINRPEKRNAVNDDIMTGLEQAILMANEPDVKALVITGEGEKAFCSGGDLSVYQHLKTEADALPMLSRMAKIVSELLLCPKPTVALMNGTAIGGGCEIAIACDFRLGRKGIKAGFVQGNLAITTGWGGGTILFEKFSSSIALQMLGKGEVYSTSELEKLGFLDKTYEGNPIDHCYAFLEKILEKETEVLEAYKEMLQRKWLASGITNRIEREAERCAVLWGGEVHNRKVDEFIHKS
ncbi:enoyl-CoA hydratase/isomerase family protein [Mesobacillus maritimus]|uniref:enoyl-CoA hydratase/isomerase family protein n=1 Tax=Mesobacillus maritimus TaxID=1643336 RepID=UPI00203A6447|nr:enoyl-CoA hydratase/isomerase family protein [Mesobacillus maritimus]MCM3587077.1 enoyl-CoA hydratase/isomerase family protein [Mesobacillus maritimus]